MLVGLPSMKNVLTPLATGVLVPVGLTTSTSTTDAAIQNNYGSGKTAVIISNEEMNSILKIAKYLEESGLSIKSVNETI